MLTEIVPEKRGRDFFSLSFLNVACLLPAVALVATPTS